MRCWNCAAGVDEGARLCPRCGLGLAAAAGMQATPARAAHHRRGPGAVFLVPAAVLVLAAIAAGALVVLGGDTEDADGRPIAARAPARAPPAAGGSAAGAVPAATTTPVAAARLNDLASYRFVLEIEGFGGPLEGIAGPFASLQGATPTPDQALSMKISGAYVRPDRGQQTVQIGSFTLGIVTIGRQQWFSVFGLQGPPDSAPRETEDYSFAASVWDNGLIDTLGSLGCAGTESVNGVRARRCGLDASQFRGLIDLLGPLASDPTSSIHDVRSGSMEVWLAEQGGYPLRVRIDLAGKGANGRDFRMKMALDVTDVNSSAIRVDPPR